jgi:hypothetical protein
MAAFRPVFLLPVAFLVACQGLAFGPAPRQPVDRRAKIPSDAVKISPDTDPQPPVLLSDEFEAPVPVAGAVNTAGAEDSPFILPEGDTLYFFFTPDVTVPVEKQVLDGVTGIYVSEKTGDRWGEPQRVWLQDPDKLAMDGCEFVQGDVIWFCSAREGYTGLHWFTAEKADGAWRNWKLADFPAGFEVGEMHMSADGTEMYFGSGRPGGKGKLDLWLSTKIGGRWQEPVNLSQLNTPDDEGWPALSPDGTELWFYRNYGIWRSKKGTGDWSPAEQILSTLAGEPTVDAKGNLYFVHHYYVDNRMIEADIYVAHHK